MSYQDIDDIDIDFTTNVYSNFKLLYENEIFQKKNNDLTVIHINIKKLSMKTFSLLQVYLEEVIKKLDILVITEIDSKKEEMTLYEMNGYNMNFL